MSLSSLSSSLLVWALGSPQVFLSEEEGKKKKKEGYESQLKTDDSLLDKLHHIRRITSL